MLAEVGERFSAQMVCSNHSARQKKGRPVLFCPIMQNHSDNCTMKRDRRGQWNSLVKESKKEIENG